MKFLITSALSFIASVTWIIAQIVASSTVRVSVSAEVWLVGSLVALGGMLNYFLFRERERGK